MEPPEPVGGHRRGTRPLGERTTVRPAEPCLGGRLHRNLGHKCHYLFWRPTTAIRLADIDGNPATTADPAWTPLEESPPIPDYDSGHAVEGGVAAQVLRPFFHTDAVNFSVCSFTLPAGQTCGDASPTLRHFTSFSQAADENAVSRIYVGFHFRDAVVTGMRHGEKIGARAVNHFLRPVHD